jgi:hypothetical protein
MSDKELKDLFAELKEILEAERESNWIRGVAAIINILSDSAAPGEANLAGARQTYRSMTSGSGSFADYYIQRDDFKERVDANIRLDQLRDRIWELLS